MGAGVIGLLTATECVRAGAEVVLIDQSDIPNPVGASNDRHRIVRALRRADPALTQAAVAARRRWISLERALDGDFYRRTGALTVLPREALVLGTDQLRVAGARARPLSADELALRYSHVRLPGAMAGILEEDAGVVLADRVLAALVGWLDAQPSALVLPRSRVLAVDVHDRAVELADGTVIRGDRLLVAAGPWSRELLPSSITAGLRLYRQTMLYCDVPPRHAAAWHATPAIPAVGDPAGSWLVAPVADAPLKLTANSACRPVDRVTDHGAPAHYRRHLVKRFRRLIPAFRESWVVGARDSYYVAEVGTGRPRLARLGVSAGFAYAACGGTSFTFAPLIATSLASRLAAGDRHRGSVGVPSETAALVLSTT